MFVRRAGSGSTRSIARHRQGWSWKRAHLYWAQAHLCLPQAGLKAPGKAEAEVVRAHPRGVRANQTLAFSLLCSFSAVHLREAGS